ncbi:hypothetical protein VUR80DRAFT_7747 [Thermomyces stellatus]
MFKSQQPDINLPRDVTLWSWLLDSRHSPLSKWPAKDIKGFTDAISGQHISFTDLKNYTTYLSSALVAARGLAEGDVIAIYCKNSIWYPVVALSAVRVGAVACGVSPEYNTDELTSSLKLTKAKFIFTTRSVEGRARRAATRAAIPSKNVILLDGVPGSDDTTIQDLLRAGVDLPDSARAEPYRLPAGKTNADICACLTLSSGTTGLPKAVMISHANIIAQCLQIQQITPADHDKVLAALPFHHITGIIHQLHLPIALNANVYVLSNFTLENMLETVAKYKIKELLIVPPILIRMVREPETVGKYDLTHVKRFSSGAAPLSKEVLALLEKSFPGTGFKQGYGMTESTSAIASHPPSKYDYKYADKVGMVVGSTEVRIVDPDTGRDCGVGEAGEIWARGPQVAMGYLDNPKATSETFDKDGFLHTGDIGRFDDEGLLAITDRMKEMIKVKGIGVAPAELEDLLLGHPAVSDVAVCGIPDARAGERPKAFVVLKPSLGVDPAEAGKQLIHYVKENKARYKWVRTVEIVEQIPKSASGKILRRKLRDASKSSGNIVVQDDTVQAKI